jgi:hypothetical protein
MMKTAIPTSSTRQQTPPCQVHVSQYFAVPAALPAVYCSTMLCSALPYSAVLCHFLLCAAISRRSSFPPNPNPNHLPIFHAFNLKAHEVNQKRYEYGSSDGFDEDDDEDEVDRYLFVPICTCL